MSTCPFVDWRGMVAFLKSITQQNDDCVIIIDGAEGSGKSSLAFQLCHALEKGWDPQERVIIDYEDWLQFYEAGQRACTYLLDEGGDLAFSRDAMSGQNKHVVRILQMARILNNIMVICCPSIHWLDKYLREHRALIYIKVHKEWHATGVIRGRATIHWKSVRFDPRAASINVRWTPVFDVYFHGIPSSDPQWKVYEKLKIAKIQTRAYELIKKAGK